MFFDIHNPPDFLSGDRVTINTTYPGKDRHGAEAEVIEGFRGAINYYIRVRLINRALAPYGFPLLFLPTELTHAPHPTSTEWTRP